MLELSADSPFISVRLIYFKEWNRSKGGVYSGRIVQIIIQTVVRILVHEITDKV